MLEVFWFTALPKELLLHKRAGCANKISDKLCELPAFISLVKGSLNFWSRSDHVWLLPLNLSKSCVLAWREDSGVCNLWLGLWYRSIRAARCSKPVKSLGNVIEGLWTHRYLSKASSLPVHCPFPDAHGLISFTAIYWTLAASGSMNKNKHSRCYVYVQASSRMGASMMM